MKIYRNVTEHALQGHGWLLNDKQFGAKDVVAVDEVAPQLDKVYDVLSNNTLSFEERISMAKLRLLEIEKELKGEDK